MPTRHAEATWKGKLQDGEGWFKGETGAVEGTFTVGSRFEDKKGSNPEELIAAANAGCYSMAFSLVLGSEGYEPKAIDTKADVTIEKKGEGFAITKIVLTTTAQVPGIDDATFANLAQKAKEGCPVSNALKAVPTELKAELLSS